MIFFSYIEANYNTGRAVEYFPRFYLVALVLFYLPIQVVFIRNRKSLNQYYAVISPCFDQKHGRSIL